MRWVEKRRKQRKNNYKRNSQAFDLSGENERWLTRNEDFLKIEKTLWKYKCQEEIGEEII